MLQELHISNFVLIDKVTIKLCEKLNVFSGATGVGKSLVIGALHFILGGRVLSDVVRNGKDEATVIGKFYITDKQLLEQLKRLSDNSAIDEEVLIQRSVDTKRRSRCRLNDVPVTVSTLKDVGELLVTIHGQHEHETLLHGINQLYILDGFGGLSPSRENFSSLHKQFTEKTKLLNELKKDRGERRQKVDLYAFQIDEIDKAQLQSGEIDKLENERNILNNAEKMYQVFCSCYSKLYESSDAIIEKLKSVVRELQSVSGLDETLSKIHDMCSQSLFQLEDAAFSLGKYQEDFSFDPQRLEYIEERLNTIRHLTAKYGHTIEDIVLFRNEIETRLKELSGDELTVEHVDKELQKLTAVLIKKGRELTEKRLSAAEKLAPLINEELRDLGIPHGRFHAQIVSPFLQGDTEPFASQASSYGFDQVDFLISPNPGEELKSLKKIASGGEISRVMLALKHQLAKIDKTPVLVFDEIDANIGGRMGEVIGEKLSSVAKTHQVLCITHLPQIACYADEQWKVNKSVRKNKTYSTIECLTGESRLEEIADMIRGNEKTEITRRQAKEMLSDAKKKVQKKG
ncbi:MAG: DNA repair protein RecN [Candidatus Brocadiaceae bacterium]|nr:DNA repair protein RecN [Candidatus Brocadiaceae bacterium]